MPRSIAIVGTGPTGLYSLARLLESARPLSITLYERARLAGTGMPYSPEAAQSSMLANIASIELPPLCESYLDWLQSEPETFLKLYGVDKATLTERSFTPRLLLGAWLRASLERLIAGAPARGHRVRLREGCNVADITPLPEGFSVTVAGEAPVFHADVVLATGHVWPKDDDLTDAFYVSPWTGLPDDAVPAGRIGILGTSLSAIDATMAVVGQHGRFSDDGAEWHPHDPDSPLRITLMSRAGLLPEADFWCPLPYEPLSVCTPEALAALAASGPRDLLDRAFRLFRAELTQADPDYAARLGLDALTVDTFPDAYFADRRARDPFAHAALNLAEVETNAAARHTVPWRYAILRMHEALETLVPHFCEADKARFEGLKRVFMDNYAAIPPLSVRRLLALRAAGVLDILALGTDYTATRDPGLRGAEIRAGRVRRRFDVFIDARGQRGLTARDLPFPSLRAALPTEGDLAPLLDRNWRLALPETTGALHLVALPYLMSRRPFIQGIPACAELGAAVARALTA